MATAEEIDLAGDMHALMGLRLMALVATAVQEIITKYICGESI